MKHLKINNEVVEFDLSFSNILKLNDVYKINVLNPAVFADADNLLLNLIKILQIGTNGKFNPDNKKHLELIYDKDFLNEAMMLVIEQIFPEEQTTEIKKKLTSL